MFSFMKGKNLRQSLIRANVPIKKKERTLWYLPQVTGHFRCGSCSVCEYTSDTKEITINGIQHVQNFFSNCNSDHVYAITCPCQRTYIGMTTQQVRKQIIQQRSGLTCQMETGPLVQHYMEMGHTPTDIHSDCQD